MIPLYLTYCIQQALFRPVSYVPTRLEYMVLTMPKTDKARRLIDG